MSIALQPLIFPLWGVRLIEASAGTGKTYTIAALYIRLILGHGAGTDIGFSRALLPCEILVMAFTKAATKELSDRIRAKLVQAARCFRGLEKPKLDEDYLIGLLAAYQEDDGSRETAAHKLMMAAESMDECAVFTIDGWVQRMLRAHAFDSGCLFEEDLVANEKEIRADALRDYWREQVYALDSAGIRVLRCVFNDLESFMEDMKDLVGKAHLLEDLPPEKSLSEVISDYITMRDAILKPLKAEWKNHIQTFAAWFEHMEANHKGAFHGSKIKSSMVEKWVRELTQWINDQDQIWPDQKTFDDKAWTKLSAEGIVTCFNKGKDVGIVIPDVFNRTNDLHQALSAIPEIKYTLRSHGMMFVERRLAHLKAKKRQAGFTDMQMRLKTVLESDEGEALRKRIRTEFPVALVDEFQDTSPEQFSIFSSLYGINHEADDCSLFMIGDPKQAIYSFRGADIHSYLAARRATEGRHYRLNCNFRSTKKLVDAVNQVFNYAESLAGGTGHPAGAFRYRKMGETPEDPVPFEPVLAKGRTEVLKLTGESGVVDEVNPMTIWAGTGTWNADDSRRFFADLAAERIATLLNDDKCGFYEDGKESQRLAPADIAILVRDRFEAAAVRQALQRRRVRSVYLSDNESVFQSQQAKDLVLWLKAVASPLDGALARAAYACPTANLPLPKMAAIVDGDEALEEQVLLLQDMKDIWQRQGVLPMLRRFILKLELPAMLLNEPGGERALTDLLHLAEILQAASYQVDGEQALIRWLCQQIARNGNDGDDRVQRLESDADLVKVITVFKSKGLQYPVVFLPFAAAAKVVNADRKFCEFSDEHGKRRLDLTIAPESVQAMERARMEEELRLLYVALTRAEHAVWLGLSTLSKTPLNVTAFGHLLSGGADIAPDGVAAAVSEMAAGVAGIAIEAVSPGMRIGATRIVARDGGSGCEEPPYYEGEFERRWAVSSYSSITKTLVGQADAVPQKTLHKVAETPMQDKLQQDDDADEIGIEVKQQAAWHTFPRGPLAGQFMHDQLEWLAREGFAIVAQEDFEKRVTSRCKLAGWENHAERTCAWLKRIVSVALPPVGCALDELTPNRLVPEMEFWLPAEGVSARAIDAVCRKHFLDGTERPALAGSTLHGMLRGFKDLVFEQGGKYWVLDYKATLLAPNDAGYDAATLQASIAKMRYDVQAAIYMLALHRLLKSRLGKRYQVEEHLGGAIVFFLRGVDNETMRGCFTMPANAEFLEEMDALIDTKTTEEEEVAA